MLANPKTLLDARYAKKEVKDQVVRADQIISKIKEINDACKESEYSEKDMLETAKFFLNANKAERSDYARKYEELAQKITETNVTTVSMDKKHWCPKCGKKLVVRTATKGQMLETSFMDALDFHSVDI